MVFCQKKSAVGDSRGGCLLSVFKGREAHLNRAIFRVLAVDGPKTISELQKQLCRQKGLGSIYYASVYKRLCCLEKAGYVESTLVEASESESRAKFYELSTKAYLALFLSRKSPE